jgi:phosphoribosyl-dephospho-CoA transferase
MFRPHDLLRLRARAGIAAAQAPAWVAKSLAAAPFVVVRRGAIRDGWIPVGVRGETRSQRHAGVVYEDEIIATITPESLATSAAWRVHPRRALPALAALDQVAEAAAELDLAWGPGGSVGFELASGARVVRADSDLDLIVRPSARHTRQELERFAQLLSDPGVRVDIVIEAAAGAVALHEWLSTPGPVLIKTECGPLLGAFAW